MKRLIVNGDDLGYSAGVNRGILQAHSGGILTSASLMVDEPGAAEAAELVIGTPSLSVGLHAVLDRGRERPWPDRCEPELERQLARFEELVGARPTHLDSHHHVHRKPDLEPIFVAFAQRHELALRDHSVRHCGLFYGAGSVGAENLLEILGGIDEGITELGCHPGYAEGLDSSYTGEREHEVRTLTNPGVRARIEELGIELIGWDAVS